MPTSNPGLARRRAAIARAGRLGDHEAQETARSDYYCEKLAETIAQIVAVAPPLTPEQRDRIAALIHGAS